MTLPAIDGHDIQFVNLSVAGESFQSKVASIAQDHYGFLWFGTLDGLYRYDGYNLKPYRHERDNPNSLSDDTVSVVYCDRAAVLWVGTLFGGLDKLDPVSNTFTHYRHDAANRASLSDNTVTNIYQDAGGALWVGTNGGLDRLDPANGNFVHYVHNSQDAGSLSSNAVFRISEDRLGNLWIGTIGEGLNRLDRSTGRFTRFHDPNNPRSPGNDTSDEARSRIREDHSGVLWVGTALSTLDTKTVSFTPYAVRSKGRSGEVVNNVRAIHEDRDGVLWLGTVSGLLALDRERKQFVRYLKNPANPHSLYNDDIACLFEDAEGNMWVENGAQGGVSRIQPQTGFYQPLSMSPAIHKAWRTTPSGLCRWTARGPFGSAPPAASSIWIRRPADTPSTSTIPTTPTASRITTLRSSGKIDRAHSGLARVAEDSTGSIAQRDVFFAYRYEPNNPSSLSSDGVQSLLPKTVAGCSGWPLLRALNRWDRRTGHFTQVPPRPRGPA